MHGGEVGVCLVIPVHLRTPTIETDHIQADRRVVVTSLWVTVGDGFTIRLRRISDPSHGDVRVIAAFHEQRLRVGEPPRPSMAIEFLRGDEVREPVDDGR